MSTPSDNKRDARREARKASMADAQAARRAMQSGDEDETSQGDDTEFEQDATEDLAPVVASQDEAATQSAILAAEAAAQSAAIAAEAAAQRATLAAETAVDEPASISKPNGASAGTSRPITRPTTGASASKTPSRPITTGAGTSKTPTRPTALTNTAGKVPSTTKTPTQPTGTIKPSATPSRPVAMGSGARVAASTGAGVHAPASLATVEGEDAALKTKRDTRREVRLADLARVQTERKRVLAQKKRQSQLRTWGLIGGIAAVFIILGVIFLNLTNNPGSTSVIKNGYGANITCGAEDTAVHYHTNLQIYVNGQNELLPAYEGFGTDSSANPCLYWLHTHARDGVIHIEAPTTSATRKFKLGDFISIWNLTPNNTIPAGPPLLSSTKFFGLPLDKQHTLTVYVDATGSGTFTKFTGDPNTIVLQPHENIWLEYGVPLVPPKDYTWTQGD